jgi:hypothetical protein
LAVEIVVAGGHGEFRRTKAVSTSRIARRWAVDADATVPSE